MTMLGHDYLALERFMKDTRHMIEFDVLDNGSRVGSPGEQWRMYLSDAAYNQAIEQEQAGHIKITKHAQVIAGNIV